MPYVRTMRARSIRLADLRRASALSGLGGLGAPACPSVQQMIGLVDPSDPCQMAGGTSADVTASIGPTCFSWNFPWIGNTITGGGGPPVCSPVFNVPSPWGTLITAGLGLYLGLKVAGVIR